MAPQGHRIRLCCQPIGLFAPPDGPAFSPLGFADFRFFEPLYQCSDGCSVIGVYQHICWRFLKPGLTGQLLQSTPWASQFNLTVT